MMPDTRTCRACGQTKPTDEFYRRSGRTCRTCIVARARAWVVAHPERRRQIDLASRRRRMADPKKRDDARLVGRLWYLRNRKTLCEKQKRAYWQDPEKAREKTRRWKRRHPEHVRAYNRRYRARRQKTQGRRNGP